MPRLHVIDCPALSPALLAHVPPGSALARFLAANRVAALTPSWPAVTCSVQATLTTGVSPSRHGIVANGLPTFRAKADADLTDPANLAEYRREVSFWEQSNQFLAAPRFWQDAHGKSRVKTALLFVQNSMPGFADPKKPAADIVVTPKPDHGPDGKLTSLLWTNPPTLVPELFGKLGPFPLQHYWGPMANINSSKWIAVAAAHVWTQHTPDLQITYVPHLDYDLQRFGPLSPQAEQAVRDLTAALEPLIEAVTSTPGASLVLLSEYAIHPVDTSFAPNRALLEAGLLKLRPSPDNQGQIIDYANSAAFAMVDHQVAHVYFNPNKGGHLAKVHDTLRHHALSIHTRVGHDVPAAEEFKLPFTFSPVHHARAGDLQITAPPGMWLDYRWWSDEKDAPAFARTIDIHRKPGYDPLELFFNPATKSIATDAKLVKGSHGSVHPGEALLVGPSQVVDKPAYHAEDVAGLLQRLLG